MGRRGKLWSHLDIAEGDTLAGKYRVDAVLGSGGMGVVLRATHLSLKDRVALKVLQKGAGEEAAERFFREAQAAARIKSPHVGRVLDVGKLDSGAPYIVMEYLEGRDLGRVLRDRGPLPSADAVGYVLQTCEALAAAHALGVIHRDIKPSNLFLSRDADGGPLVKVVDFGVSKQTRASEYSSLTGVQTAIGTPSYMSPEQLRSSKSVDARADLWSLGVVLFELLTGRLPFDADSLAGLVALLIDPTALAPRVGEHRAGVPDELQAVVARCLEKDPERRFANVAELASALAPFGGETATASAARTARIFSKAEMAMSSEMTLPGLGEPHDTVTAFSTTRWPRIWAEAPENIRRIAIPAILVAFIGGWVLLPRMLSSPHGSASAVAPVKSSAAPQSSQDAPAETSPVGPEVTPVQIEDLPKDALHRRSIGPASARSVNTTAPQLVRGAPAPSASTVPSPSATPRPRAASPDDLSNPYEIEINPYKK
jgi:serine/threonine-protein kinase